MGGFSFCDLRKNLCDLTDTVALTRHMEMIFRKIDLCSNK